MILSDQETLNLIEMLISKYVPAGLDKTNVLEKLHGLDKIALVPLANKCPACKGEMICMECGDFDVTTHTDVDVTVKLNGKVIYDG